MEIRWYRQTVCPATLQGRGRLLSLCSTGRMFKVLVCSLLLVVLLKYPLLPKPYRFGHAPGAVFYSTLHGTAVVKFTEKMCDDMSVANLTEPYARNSTIVMYSAHEQMHDGGRVVTVIGVADRHSLSSTSFACRLSTGNELTGCHDPAAFWETLATAHELPEHDDKNGHKGDKKHIQIGLCSFGKNRYLPQWRCVRLQLQSAVTSNDRRGLYLTTSTDLTRMFGAIFVHCPISAGHARPDFVSLTVNGTDSYLHTLKVTSPEEGPPRWQMALCVPPIHSGYNDWQQVVETLELLQMLGVDHAVMYTLDVGSNVTSVLDHYVRSGFLRLHAWPVLPQPVHYFGQMAAVNDCLLRMRNVSRLVMFSDLDEAIVPHQHQTLPELLKHVLKEHKDPDHVAAFAFLNAFYFSVSNGNATQAMILNSTSLSSDQLRLAESLRLRTVSRLYHGKIFKNTERSKCIVDPLKVTLMQIHFVRKFVNGFTSVAVDTNLALLHHYRVKEYPKVVLVKETSALQFASELINRVTAVRTALGFDIKASNKHTKRAVA